MDASWNSSRGMVVMMLLLLLSSLPHGTALSSEGIDLFSCQWNDPATGIGLVTAPEIESLGPLSFSTDGTDIFILDSAHQRVVKINKSGKVQPIAVAKGAWTILTDGEGGVFVQEGTRVRHHSAKGTVNDCPLNAESPGENSLIEGYGNELMVSAAGTLQLRSVTQKVLDVEGAPPLKGLAQAENGGSSPALSYTIKRLDGNEVRILGSDPQGKVLVSVPIKLDEGTAGAALFKGIDSSGNLYVEVEILRGNNVGLAVHRYSPAGERLAAFTLPNDYHTTVYKKTEITPDGNVYQMLTTPDGLRIIKY